MKIDYGTQQPAIHIYYHSLGIDPSLLNQIGFGIEEENVPYVMEGKEEGTAYVLGYQGAEDSRLGVGIGIGQDGMVVLHYKKLRVEEPLFQIHIHRDHGQLRKLGANGARLVKGIPFKELGEQENEKDLPEEVMTREDMALLIAKVVNKMMKAV